MHTAAKCCLSFCLGLFAATLFGVSFPFWVSALLGATSLLCFFLGRWIPVKQLGAFLLIAAIGAVYFSGYLTLTFERAQPFGEDTAVVTGSVREISERDNGYTYTIKADQIGNTAFPIPILVNLYTEEKVDACYGDVLTATAKLYPVEAPTPVALWDTSAAKGIDLTGSVVSAVEVTSGRITFSGLCLALRDLLRDSLRVTIPMPESGVLEGILFGKRDHIPYSVTRDFNRSGIAHVLAVSGLHIAIFTALLAGLFSLLKIPVRFGRVMILAFLAIFCAMAGFTPSVLRACLMAGILTIGKMNNRYLNSVDVLLLAAVVILLFSPYCIVNLSFLLSFFSVLGILLFAKPLEKALRGDRCKKMKGVVIGSVSVSLAAMVFTTPILAIAFGCFSILSPLVNLLVIPLMAPLMAFGFLTAVTGLFFPPVAQLCGFVAQQLCSILLSIASLFSNIPFAVLPTGYEYVPYLILACLLLFLLTLMSRRKAKLFAVTGWLCLNLTLVGVLSYQLLSADQLHITVLENLYQNPVLIECCGKTVLINCTNEYGAETVCSYLDSRGIGKIDLIAFCGTDVLSAAGLELLLQEVPVDYIYAPSDEAAELFSVMAEQEGVTVLSADRAEISMSPVTVTEEELIGEDVLFVSCNGFTVAYSDNSSSLAAASRQEQLEVALLDVENAPSQNQIAAEAVLWLRDDAKSDFSGNAWLIPTGSTSHVVTDGNRLLIQKGGGWE